eukprot:scaffold64410_cov18-Tisochrysis_lutea.AAC.1
MECLRSNSEEGRRLEWRVLLHLHVCMTCERLLFAGSGGGAATDVKDTSQPQGKGQANQLDEVQGGLDPKDLKKPCAPAPATPERPPPSKPRLPLGIMLHSRVEKQSVPASLFLTLQLPQPGRVSTRRGRGVTLCTQNLSTAGPSPESYLGPSQVLGARSRNSHCHHLLAWTHLLSEAG